MSLALRFFLEEYNTNKGPWLKMPKTMIQKVAECGALRMAFPDELGGVYGQEEMMQAGRGNPDHKMALQEAKDSATYEFSPDDIAKGKRTLREASPLADAGEFEITFGELKGVKLNQCSPEELTSFVERLTDQAMNEGKEIKPTGPVGKCFTNIEAYLAELEGGQ
jgi:hypothetical protein